MKSGFILRCRQAAGILNFFLYRLFYRSSFAARNLSVIMFSCQVNIDGNGRLVFNGKVKMAPHSRLASKGRLEIGESFTLNSYSRIVAFDDISIGSNVTIAQFVSILDHDHRAVVRGTGADREMHFDGYSCAPISIGSNVWIADKVTILKGVKIGSNVIIGANSVVTSDIPDFSVAVGSPAKVVKSL